MFTIAIKASILEECGPRIVAVTSNIGFNAHGVDTLLALITVLLNIETTFVLVLSI